MSSNTPRRTGSPYNPQNNADAQDQLADPFADVPTESLADRLEALAVEKTGLPEECFTFPEMLTPRQTENGMVVTDNRNLVKYNLETAEFSPTTKLREMIEVENHNQHAATTVESMILG